MRHLSDAAELIKSFTSYLLQALGCILFMHPTQQPEPNTWQFRTYMDPVSPPPMHCSLPNLASKLNELSFTFLISHYIQFTCAQGLLYSNKSQFDSCIPLWQILQFFLIFYFPLNFQTGSVQNRSCKLKMFVFVCKLDSLSRNARKEKNNKSLRK